MEDIERVQYEQCPFNWAHIARLYRNIAREPEMDGPWSSPPGRGDIFYRRYGDYFQFIAGNPKQSLFSEFLGMEPMVTEDDAAWTIEKHGPVEYLVRSSFARTYGPVRETEKLHKLLEPYDMWLENRGTHVEGAATFDCLTNVKLLKACRKLLTLEGWCMSVNRDVERFLNDRWGAAWSEVNLRLEEDGPSFLTTESAGGKRRNPIPSGLIQDCPEWFEDLSGSSGD